uniref:NADH-ubiquinone oxidoreductase chain 4L n=2 Tax=Coleoptera TaxID=7041 RepID=A0A346RH84_9COLE|nr:NADH dehydrogenase subunit 4L [Coleoptera sp. 18 KM-2017]AXS66607.1 NADH dehydrogenase subunit 4L [Tenebrionoidea sp. 22 KM-2017]
MIYLNSLIMFLVGLVVFSMKRKHLLLMLLSLEFIILSMFMMMFLYLSILNMEMYFVMIFLIFSVCEGVVGLSILVSLIRTHGNDYFQSFNMLW